MPIEHKLSGALDRSEILGDLISSIWHAANIESADRARAPAVLCELALDHARALRRLLAEVPASAISLLRPQYEALVRAVWARHAATESDLARLLAPLTVANQQAAKKLPGISVMLAAIEKSGPRGAGMLLSRAHTQLSGGLNSFIHGGIHPFHRNQHGYPAPLVLDVLKNANAVSMLTLVVLAELTDDLAVTSLLSDLHEEFQDVLPALEPFDV